MKCLCQLFNPIWFTLPIRSTPIDWKTPTGYLIELAWQYTSIFMLISFLANLTPMAISFFLFADSLRKDWKHDLRAVKKLAKGKQFDLELSKLLGEFIRSHSNLKELRLNLRLSKKNYKKYYYSLLFHNFQVDQWVRWRMWNKCFCECDEQHRFSMRYRNVDSSGNFS